MVRRRRRGVAVVGGVHGVVELGRLRGRRGLDLHIVAGWLTRSTVSLFCCDLRGEEAHAPGEEARIERREKREKSDALERSKSSLPFFVSFSSRRGFSLLFSLEGSCVERGRKNSNAKSECSIFFSIPLKVFSLTLFGFALSFPSLLSFTRAVSFFSLSPAVVRLRSPTLILLSSRARPFKKQPCRPCSRRRSTSLSRSENNNREKKKLRQRLPTSMPPSRSSSEFVVVVVVSHSLCAFQLSGRYQRTIGWRSADRNREKQTQKKEENRLKRRVHFNQQNAGRHCRSKKPQPRPPPSPLFST